MICIPLSYGVYFTIGNISNDLIGSIFFLLILLVPTLYFSNLDYKLIFQKPTKNEIMLAVLMFIAYIIYSTIFSSIVPANTIPAVGNNGTDAIELFSMIFKMMAEELLKFIPLMFLLRVFYKYTSNRQLSIIASSIITLIYFGAIHSIDGTNIISVLIIQGAGLVFHLYAYLKTKNLFVSYLSHLMTDAFVTLLMILGMVAG